MDNGCATVCIPASYVRQVADYLRYKDTKLRICTVVGFPNGYSTTAVKVFETKEAVSLLPIPAQNILRLLQALQERVPHREMLPHLRLTLVRMLRLRQPVEFHHLRMLICS